MAYVYYNPNPTNKRVGDCAVRAIAVALGISWYAAYNLLCANGRAQGDMPSSDAVWGDVLRRHGFHKAVCPNCGSARRFAQTHPQGVYVLGFGGHTATIIDGKLYDSWDSSNETPIYFWYKE